jgi:hypothetical protein
VLVGDSYGRVQQFRADGTFVGAFGPTDTGADLSDPVSVAVASDGTVAVLDETAERVVLYRSV